MEKSPEHPASGIHDSETVETDPTRRVGTLRAIVGGALMGIANIIPGVSAAFGVQTVVIGWTFGGHWVVVGWVAGWLFWAPGGAPGGGFKGLGHVSACP